MPSDPRDRASQNPWFITSACAHIGKRWIPGSRTCRTSSPVHPFPISARRLGYLHSSTALRHERWKMWSSVYRRTESGGPCLFTRELHYDPFTPHESLTPYPTVGIRIPTGMQTPTCPPKVHNRQSFTLEITPIYPLCPPPVGDLGTPLPIIIFVLFVLVLLGRAWRINPRDLQLYANQSNS